MGTDAIDIRPIADWLMNQEMPSSERKELNTIVGNDTNGDMTLSASEFAVANPGKSWEEFCIHFERVSRQQLWRMTSHDNREATEVCEQYRGRFAEAIMRMTPVDVSGILFCSDDSIRDVLHHLGQHYYMMDNPNFTLFFPTEFVLPVVQQGMKSGDPDLRRDTLRQVQYLPVSERLAIVQQGLKDGDEFVRSDACWEVQYLPASERLAILQQGMKDKDWIVRTSALDQVQYLLASERLAIVQQGLKDGNTVVHEIARKQEEQLATLDRPMPPPPPMRGADINRL